MMSQNNLSEDVSKDENLIRFQALLQEAGFSEKVAREHTEKLAEVIALAVLERILSEKVVGPVRTEAEMQHVLAQSSKDELRTLISEESQGQLEKYFAVIKPLLKPADQKSFIARFGL